MSPNPGWREYQDKVAIFLSQLGFEVQTDEVIRGARAAHAVDVSGRMRIAGLNLLWLVECKRWKRRVPKERVLAFRTVVEDIGGDRGLIFSESGFQIGAVRAAENTNVTLTSLEEFELSSATEVSSAKAKVLDERIATLMQAFANIWNLLQAERAAAFARYLGPPGLAILDGTPHAVIGVTTRLSQMRQALEDARFNHWPVAYFPLDHVDGELIDIKSWDGLLFVAERTLTACQRIYDHMFESGESSPDWTEFQPPELTELLRNIRLSSSGGKPEQR